MEAMNDAINFEGKNIQPEITGIIYKMLEKYNNDDLVDLLCECEMLLQTNETYVKKLNEHGFKKLFNLISGIERETRLRLLNNFQILHTTTLNIQKIIISRINDLTFLVKSLNERQQKDNIFMQQCINFLRQKVIDELDKKVDLLEWFNYDLIDYISYSDTKKVLQIVSDIYAITKGRCEVRPNLVPSVMDKLELANVKISPDDFAKEIIRDSDCLPLYMKDELDYDDSQYHLSDYGGIICKAYKWVMNPDIQDLLVGPNDSIETLCLPPLKKLIADRNINDVLASALCQQLLQDLKKLYEGIKKPQIEGAPEPPKPPKKMRKYSLSVLTAPYLYEYSISKGNYLTKELKCSKRFWPDKKEMEDAIKEISSFSPAIIAKSNGIEENDLYARNKDTHFISFADLCFCLWFKKREQDIALDRNAKYIVLFDYYGKYFRVSCYNLDDIGNISKLKPWIDIKYNRLKENIMEDVHTGFFPDISKAKFNMDISKGEIVIYRLFESDSYAGGTKLDDLRIFFIDKLWDKLSDADDLKVIIDFLYEHKLIG